ncbi:PREDICTED: uncharacterized protein LOC108615725 [Drosophila arizonae]|uniref:Uncharacterized protein LOC108615725 n=1 Tax=Drosophila arizonae TaxID=7263 RepID=A0ABM1PFD4_DROAR|nr:PREDICTED: uncharacterized protein LOC108615725 [Drosophila arizonae]
MVNVGCVAKLLSGLHLGSSFWVKRVNPHWYEARELPKTLLSEKLAEKVPNARTTAGRKYTKPCLTMTPLTRRSAML